MSQGTVDIRFPDAVLNFALLLVVYGHTKEKSV